MHLKRKIGVGGFGLIYVGVYRDCHARLSSASMHRSVKHTRVTVTPENLRVESISVVHLKHSNIVRVLVANASSLPRQLLGSCRIEAVARRVVGASQVAVSATVALRCGLTAAAAAAAAAGGVRHHRDDATRSL